MVRFRQSLARALACGITLAAALPVMAAERPVDAAKLLSNRLCGSLSIAVDSIPGKGPAFLRSYDAASGSGAPAEPALKTAAFTYDNALAVIALTACGERAQAKRIGEALLTATLEDRAGPVAGRLRTAYRAGPQQERPIPPNGWWQEKPGRWAEDAYQVGTSTGNVAWAGLALLTLAESTGDKRFQEGAAKLGQWVLDNTADTRGQGGFTGGLHGYDTQPVKLTWKSTEHNTDLLALFGWLQRTGTPGPWADGTAKARGFLDVLWRADKGWFPTGTLADGATVNEGNSGLDAQLWPLLLADAPAEWQRALSYAEQAHGVEGGFDFNADRDGVWVEGTAQAALAYRATGQAEKAAALLESLTGDISPGGYLWATRGEKISTGFAIGPDSKEADFFYFRQPHLGATAWAVLAAKGWNPFTGKRLEP